MQALAGCRLEQRVVGRFVMPGLEGRVRFHGREDVDQTGVIAALGKEFLDPILFAECLELTNKLDVQGQSQRQVARRSHAVPRVRVRSSEGNRTGGS